MSFLLFALFTAGVVAAFLHKGERELPLPSMLRTHLTNAGIWSYSLYLWHQPFVAAVPRLISRIAPHAHIHPLLMFLFCISLWIFAVPLAGLSYQFLELPSISIGKRFYARKRQAVPA
jgi:peptidoglycan/LPS O-acetylase OafA/YrhL